MIYTRCLSDNRTAYLTLLCTIVIYTNYNNKCKIIIVDGDAYRSPFVHVPTTVQIEYHRPYNVFTVSSRTRSPY